MSPGVQFPFLMPFLAIKLIRNVDVYKNLF